MRYRTFLGERIAPILNYTFVETNLDIILDYLRRSLKNAYQNKKNSGPCAHVWQQELGI